MNLRQCEQPTDLIGRWDVMASDCFDRASKLKALGKRKRFHEVLARGRALQQAADELYGLTDAHLIPELER